jgi:hypothetical protein
MGMRTTLFLVAIIGGLSATLWFTDRKPPENKVVQTAALEGRSLGDCKVMRWKFADQPAIEVSKDAKGYFSLSEPIVDLAAFAYMKQIVNAWDSAQLLATDFVNDPKGQQETGLQVPEVEFTAEWPDGKKIQIDVGATGPLGTDRFMRREGRIYRGGEGIYESLRVGIDDLRERAVFLTTEAQCAELLVEQIQETGKRERLHLERDRSNGGWRLKEPRASRAEQGAAIQFVTGVLSLRADDFPGGLWRLPEREPDLVITVRGARGEESVKLWEAEGSVFGLLPGRNGIGFTTGNRGYSQIFQNQAQSLRATILLPFQNLAESLAEMQIDPGQGRGDRIRLVRSTVAEEWRLIEPVEFRAGATPVNELIQGLNNLRVIEFADDLTADSPQCGLGVGRLQVSVRGLDQKELTTLWIGADVTKNDLPLCYVCRADDPAGVVLVPRPATDLLRRQWASYCNRDVLRLTTTVERLELRRGTAHRTFRTDGKHWQLDGVDGARDEVGGFVNDVLRDLRGRAAVDLRGGSYGEPDWTMDLCRENGDVLITLRAWDRSKQAPLVLQPLVPQGQLGSVGFEVEEFVSKSLRELWQ